MARISPNDPCPCGGGKYKKCCRPAHEGTPAATPEALMRSRFSAFALGLADYLIATTDPDGPQWQAPGPWKASIEALCAVTTFDRLEVLDASARGDEGWVTFRAHMTQRGRPAGFSERSRFVRRDGRWLYHSGDVESA